MLSSDCLGLRLGWTPTLKLQGTVRVCGSDHYNQSSAQVRVHLGKEKGVAGKEIHTPTEDDTFLCIGRKVLSISVVLPPQC